MGDMGEDFKALRTWNKKRDYEKRCNAIIMLEDQNIEYKETSQGCFKIKSNLNAFMYYPKSGTIIWKRTKYREQHKFHSASSIRILKEIKMLLKLEEEK